MTVAELQALLLATHRDVNNARQEAEAAQRKAALATQAADELAQTVARQREQIEKKDRQILELLQALRGKRRERVDPHQLLLFEAEELTALLDEQDDDATDDASTERRRRRRGRRPLPDDLPREEVVHELPESERLCPVDGEPMPRIRWEVSEQLEYEPASLKVIVHKRAVYACPQKHDEATLATAPKPPQPIEKGLAGPG